MLRIPREIKSFSSPVWGGKPSTKLVGGPMYHEVVLETNLFPEHIAFVNVIKNGDTIYRLSGEDIKFIQRYCKQYDSANFFVIAFADKSGKSLEGQVISGLNTVQSDSIDLKVELVADPAGAGGAPALPELKAYAWVSNSGPDAPVAKFQPRVRRENLIAGASGIVSINNVHLLADGRERLRRFHIDGGANDIIKHLEVKRDGLTVYEASLEQMRFDCKRNEKSPQPLWFHFDPIQGGFILSELFSTAHQRELEFRFTLSEAAMSLPCIIETMEEQAPTQSAAVNRKAG